MELTGAYPGVVDWNGLVTNSALPKWETTTASSVRRERRVLHLFSTAAGRIDLGTRFFIWRVHSTFRGQADVCYCNAAMVGTQSE